MAAATRPSSRAQHAEERGSEGAEPERKRRKKRKKRELVLEDEDYELLEENTGIRRQRPQQHRRIKKARDMGADAERADNAATLKEQLFGPEDEGLEDEVEDAAADEGRGGGMRGGSPVDEFAEEEDQVRARARVRHLVHFVCGCIRVAGGAASWLATLLAV